MGGIEDRLDFFYADGRVFDVAAYAVGMNLETSSVSARHEYF